MPFRRKRFGFRRKKSRRPARGKRFGGKGFKKRGGRRGIPRAVKEMIAITEPMSSVYSWATRYQGNANKSMVIPLACWNDSYDLAIMHNFLRTRISASTVGPLNKFAVGDFQQEFTIKNESNMEITIDFFSIVARNDMDSALAPQVSWNPSGSVVYPNFFLSLSNGYGEMTGASAPTNINWPIGVTPFDVNVFCTYYKVLKRGTKRGVLMPGAGARTFKLRDRKWRIWNGTKIQGATGSTNGIDTTFGRRTRYVFAIVTGYPYTDSVSTNACVFSPPNVLVSGKERYMFTGTPNAQKYLLFAQDVNTITNSPSTIDMMTEATGPYVIA